MEQDAFFGYEKYASKGWNSGNSRNGSYTRVFHTKYGALNIVIPRDRNGLQGITPDGQKEVLDYAICPTEAAENYVELLRGLKKRGLRQVLLFVSDGLGGLADALKAEYMIENNNKGLKHRAKLKEQFPNEESLDRFACAYYSDCNQKAAGKAHKGFKEAASVLLEMFSPLEAFFLQKFTQKS